MNVFILYKTIRIETGEYYIGIHSINTDKYPRFNDPYLGSGTRFEASKKKHGAKAFKRTILSISESRDVVLALEAAMVTVEMIADPLCLNLAPGGRGGGSRKGLPSPLRGIPRGPKSAETRQKMSDTRKGVSTGPRSAETRQAISDARKGVSKSAETRQKMSDTRKGVSTGPRSVETRQAMSDSQKERWRQRKLKSKLTQ